MAVPSTKFPGFYHVPRAPSAIIDSEGHVIRATDGNPFPCWVDEQRGVYRTRITHEGGYYFANIATLIAEVFIPVPEDLKAVKRLIVIFSDGIPANHSLKNLSWGTTSDVLNKRWGIIRAKNAELYPLPKFDAANPGLFPNAIECAYKPGYYFIPIPHCHVVVNKHGQLYHLLNGTEHPTYSNLKGYLHTALIGPNGKYKAFTVHRLVASLFVGKPDRHTNEELSDLQVNHIDGIKSNNSHINLEWVTLVENMKHAWATGLVGTEKPVLIKNIATGEIVRYNSLSECARDMTLTVAEISKHLRSSVASRIVKNGFVFKDDNGHAWPLFTYTERDRLKLNGAYDQRAVVSIETISGKVELFNSLPEAVNLLGLNFLRVRNWRIRKGHFCPCDGYLILSLAEHLAQLDG